MKNYQFLFVILFAFLTQFSFAELRSAKALSTKLQDEKYTADLQEGFHFNDKAPNEILIQGKSIKPTVLLPRHLEFAISKEAKDIQAELYVCDDKITFCETHSFRVKGNGASAEATQIKDKKTKINKNGFIENNLDQAFSTAAKKHQLVLIDFSARWCPGCVRYKNEIFPTSEFKKLSKDFVKVEVDTDFFQNFVLSDKYKIVGIPTLIITNEKGDEIDRVVDYEPVDTLKPFIQAIQADPTPLEQLLKTDASADQQTQYKVGKRLFASGRAAESIAFLSRVQPAPSELLSARVTVAHEAFDKDPTQKDAYIKELREALKVENQTTRSVIWRTELIAQLGEKSPEIKSILAEGLKLSEEFLQNPEKLKAAIANDDVGEFRGYERWVVAFNKADLVEAGGATPADIDKIWGEAADIGAAYKIPVQLRGPALRYLSILATAKRWPEAEAQANAILKLDPNNDDVSRRKLKILVVEKKFSDAIKIGEKIIGIAEGRNQFWVAEFLAKAYLGQENKDSAKKILTAYLARPEINEKRMKSSKKEMEEVLKTIQ